MRSTSSPPSRALDAASRRSRAEEPLSSLRAPADELRGSTRSLVPSPPRARLEEQRASMDTVTVKGFYMRALLRELANQGHHTAPAVSYRDFGNYPASAAYELLLECKQRMYPHERRNEAMRRLGWIIYPTLLSTMVGRVIFGSLGSDLTALLRAAGRGFEVSISHVRYEVVELGERTAKVRVYDFPLFPDCFLAGVFEGALAHYGYDEGKVSARMLSPQDVELALSW